MKLVGRLKSAELAAKAMVRMTYPPFDVLVARTSSGEVLAIEDACNHAGASLAVGEMRGDCVVCPMHGYVFELRSGRLKSPRGLCADQRTFEVREEGDEIVVWDTFSLDVSP